MDVLLDVPWAGSCRSMA